MTEIVERLMTAEEIATLNAERDEAWKKLRAESAERARREENGERLPRLFLTPEAKEAAMQYMRRRDAPRKQRWHIAGTAGRDSSNSAIMLSACGTYDYPLRGLEYRSEVPEGAKLCRYCAKWEERRSK